MRRGEREIELHQHSRSMKNIKSVASVFICGEAIKTEKRETANNNKKKAAGRRANMAEESGGGREHIRGSGKRGTGGRSPVGALQSDAPFPVEHLSVFSEPMACRGIVCASQLGRGCSGREGGGAAKLLRIAL